MKTIDRYLFQEHLLPVVYCLAAFFTVFVTWHLFDHLSMYIEARTPLFRVVRFYLFLLLPSLEHLAPTALLLGTLYSLWQLSRHNELSAMRAGGISLYRLILPFLGIALAFTLGIAAMKETVAPRMSRWAQDFERADFHEPARLIIHSQPYYSSVHRRSWLIGRFDPLEPQELHDVKVTEERPDGSLQREITAKKAVWMDGTWWFFDVFVQDISEYDVPIGTPRPMGPVNGAVCEIPFLTETPSDFATQAKMSSGAKLSDESRILSSMEIWRYVKRHPNLSSLDRAVKLHMLHSRLAMPWACFIVTLLAIPAGSRSMRQGALSGIFLGLGCFFAYYALAQAGLLAARREWIAPWLGAWLSNIVFLVTGLSMLVRMR